MAKKYWWEEDNEKTTGSSTNQTSSNSSAQTGKKYWWDDYENQTTTQNSGKGYWWEDGNISNRVGGHIANRVNTWLQNHNSYVTDYQNRYANRKYSYEDAFVSDSGRWLDSVSEQMDKYEAERQEILSYMDQYSSYLDADWVKSVQDTLAKGREAQLQIRSVARNDFDWWNSFNNEELVQKYGSAEDAYKYYQRSDGYSKKYAGQTYNQLTETLKGLEDGEEKDWLGSYASQVDYDEKSKFDLEAGAREIEDLEAQKEALIREFEAMDVVTGTPEGNKLNNEFLRNMEEFDKQISQKKAYLTLAKRVQEGIRLASVADKESGNYDPEFANYAAQGLTFDYTDFGSTKSHFKRGAKAVSIDRYRAAAMALHEHNGNEGAFANTKYDEAVAIYRKMKDSEFETFAYYLAKDKENGTNLAEQYIDSIDETLRARRGYDIAKDLDSIDIPVIEDIAKLGHGFGSGIISSLTGITQAVRGEKLPTDVSQYANQYVAESLDGLGYYAHNAATTIGNMAPSILLSTALGPGVGAVAGAGVVGVSAGGNAFAQALDWGYDKTQAGNYGVLVGAAEGLLQYMIGGIGKLGGLSGKITSSTAKLAGKVAAIDNSLLRVAAKLGLKGLNLGINIGSEIVEEELQNFLEPAFRTIVFGEEYDAPTIDELVETAIVTALSTGVLEGGDTSRSVNKEVALNREAVKLYGESTKELIEEGLASDVGSKSHQLAEMFKRKTDKGKSMTGYEIRQQVEANEAQFVVENYEEALPLAKQRLTELGETKDVDKIAELVAKRASGQVLTPAEKSALVRSQYGAKVAKEMTPSNDPNQTYKPLESRVGTESSFGVSESGQATIQESGEAFDIKKAEVVAFTTDKATGKITDVTFKTEDGTEVQASGIDFANSDQSYLVEAVSKIENITPAAATAIIRDYDPSLGQSVGEYLNGIDEAYTYGYHGYSTEDMKAGNFATKLTDKQSMSAYRLGESAKKIGIESQETNYKRMRTAAQAKMSAEQRAAQQKARIESEDVEVYFQDGKTVVKFDEHSGKYDDKRMAAVNTAKFLSKLGIGGKYYFFESYLSETLKDENGDALRVYKDDNGNEVEAPNGIYTKDGIIYIDLNAGTYGQGAALFTMGHELTHFIKDKSEKQFKVLCDLVTEAFDKTDLSMHKRVLAKQKFLEDKRDKAVSYEEAYEEVVADAMSTMLSDGSFYEKIMEIKVKDKGLFNTIKRFFEKMIAKFTKAYEKLTPDQQDATDIRQMKDMFDRIQTAFAEALVEASENFQAAMESVVETNAEAVSTEEIITEGAVVTNGEGERFSIRSMKHDIAQGQMFRDLMNVCGWTQAQVSTLRNQLNDLVEYMIPYRNILDMNESYGMEGRRFSPYKPNSDPLYKISMDFSTLCSKRLLTQYVIEQLQLRENRPMSAEEQMAIRDMLNEYRKVEKGLQVACAMCYVEAARLKSPKQMQRWLDDPTPHLINYFALKNSEFNASVKKAQADFKESRGYDRNAPKKDMKQADVRELNKIGPRMRAKYQPSAAEQAIIEKAKTLPNSTYLTAGNLASLSETDPAIYDAYTSFVRTATRSKSLETDEPYYYGDSTRDNGNGIVVTDSFIEAVNRENGMRFSSWSDWRIQHLLDYITAVIDNSVRGAAMHGYTKFGDEVRVLGKTGMMFNMSGVAGTQTGLNEDGSLNFSETESIDVNEAIQLREEFPEHAGLQCIGVSNEHIIALLRSDIIDYVIPYHVSGLNADLRRMAKIYGWKDYTGTQHASIDKSVKLENAVDKEHWHQEPVFSEFFVGYDTGMSGIDAMRESAERYKQMCKDRGLTPKFNQFASEENYWKLLIDRKMINQQTGNLIRQKAVTPTFDFDTIKGVVDKFVDNYDAGLEGRALNHIVENWDSIPQRIKELKKKGGTKAKQTKKAAATLANQTVAAQPKDGAKKSDRKWKPNLDSTEWGSVKKSDRGAAGAKFSLRNSVEETADLVAMHNITPKLLLDALGRKGLLMPSLAITNKGMNDFGDISLLFDKSTIDPEASAQNKLYGADAWTPTQTQLKKNAKFDTNKTVNTVNSIKEHIGSAYASELFNITAKQFRDTIVKADGSIYDAYAHNLGMQTAYAMEKGIITKIPTTKNGNVNAAALQEQLNAELDTDNGWRLYKRWLNNISDTIITRYDQASNEDILKNMRAQPATAKAFKLSESGELVVPAVEYSSIDEARKNKSRLSENAAEATKAVADELLAFAKKVGGNTKTVVGAINTAFGQRYSAADIVKTFGQQGVKISTAEASQLQALYKKAVELPTQYFEAKPQREVGLDEIKAVVMPDTNDGDISKVKAELEKMGVPVIEYENGSKESRTKAVNSVEGLKFSERDSRGKQLGEDQLEYFEKSMARDHNGNLQVVYHGGTVKHDTRYSERGGGTSNRSLLANAFETITSGSEEYKLIQKYKGYIAELNSLENKLSDMNAQIRKIRFTKGEYDAEKLARLEGEAEKIRDAINKYDRYLLSLEASEPLRKVIERERKKEAKKTNEHVKEIQENKKVKAEQTELRHKIRKAVRDLDKILKRGNKQKNVKEDLQPVVTKALKAADILFTEHYGNYDMLRNGIEADLSDAEEALVATCARMLNDIDKMPTDGYENFMARQEAEKKLSAKMSKLKDVFARERKRLNNTTVSSILGDLADAYATLENSEQSYVQGAYNEAVHNFLKNLQSEVGGTVVQDMTKNQLENVYAAYQMVLTTVRKANQLFNQELKMSREQMANAVIREVIKAGGTHGLWTKAEIARSQAEWNNMKPVWVANRIGSESFAKLMQGLFEGQYNFAVDIEEAKQFKLEMDKKYKPRSWDAEKLYEFESTTGKKFSLNLQQIMSLYAFSKREQAYSHILNGGFVFEGNSTVIVDEKGRKKTYIHNGATSYKLNEATLNDIINTLTAEQKAYADEMQKYLSEVMGAKGNEVSMQLYGIKMFNEQFYFPLRSSGAYMERAKEAEMKKQQGQINLVNSGFTHAVKPQAKNPIILSGFMDVWAEHCNEMSMYHSMVLPMEDFRKVYNYSTVHDENFDSASVFQTIQDAYGNAATAYIDQLYRELNAGATVDPRETAFKARISNFKKAAVMLSGSVVVQQFSSIGRAFAIIDPRHFIGAKVNSGTNLSAVEEMKKYAPVAIIKEMGGFDTGTKGSAKSYIMAEKYSKGERLKGLLKDEQYRSDIMGYMPAKADELTWCAIWEAAKRETKAKHPNMDVKSEEFLKLAGARFSEVIEKTQVYDSVLARSANMRSKSGLMQMATAFMAEPTTAINLLEDAIRSGKAKNIARVFGSVGVSILLNNALASIVYAMRDDDEDETFLEKYFQSFTSGLIDDINPMSYYPFLKDVWSLFQGYDVERADMSVIADIRDALKNAVAAMGKYDSDMDDEELAEFYKSVGSSLLSVLDAGCSMFGVPVKNVRRDAMGIINAWNTASKDLSDERDNSWLSFWDKVGAAVKDTIPVYAWTKDKAKTDMLYEAIVSGDNAYLGRLKSTYKTEDAYSTAVRKALRENDPRVHEAAQARYDGNTEEYKRIFREIRDEGVFTWDEIMDAVNSEENAIKNKLEPDKATSTYSASDFVQAIAMNDIGTATAARDDIIATHVANGKSQKDAEKEFVASVKSNAKEAYLAGLLDDARAKEMLMEYTDMDEEEVASRVDYWAFCEEYPKYKDVFTESHVGKYHEFAEPAEISVDVYAQYITGTKDLKTIKDEWGDVEVTLREQVLEVIDSLPLTWQQKDALYLAHGYSENTIWDVPW